MERTDSDLTVVKERDVQTIKCSNCNKKLLFVHVDKAGSDIMYKVRVQCFSCGECSFDFPVRGVFRPMPAPGVALSHVEDLPNDVVKFVTVKGPVY